MFRHRGSGLTSASFSAVEINSDEFTFVDPQNSADPNVFNVRPRRLYNYPRRDIPCWHNVARWAHHHNIGLLSWR
jgi:hypothetical protein